MTKQKNKRKNDRLEGIFQHDEEILWQGRPNLNKHFTKEDILLIPLSLMTGSVFIIVGVLFIVLSDGLPYSMVCGILSVMTSLYLIFGRFIHKYFLKRKTIYFVTDKRAIVVSEFMRFSVKPYTIRRLNELFLDGSNLFFAPPKKLVTNRGIRVRTFGEDAGFLEIDGAEDVYQLILSLRPDLKDKKKNNDKRKTQAQE